MTDPSTAHPQKGSWEQESEVPDLFYYNIRGLSQPVRNIMYHLNIPFRNVRVSNKEEEKQNKKDHNSDDLFDSSLPIFKNSQLKISNCIAIAIYVCQKYAGGQLLGHSLRTKGKINQIMFKYSVDMHKTMPSIMDIVVKSSTLEGNIKNSYVLQGLKKLISQSKFISFCLKQHAKTSKWILESLTIIDFYFYETCFYVCGFFLSSIQNCQELKGFQSFLQCFDGLGLSEIEAGKKEQVGVFLQFKNEKMQEIVRQGWNGDKNWVIV